MLNVAKRLLLGRILILTKCMYKCYNVYVVATQILLGCLYQRQPIFKADTYEVRLKFVK